MYLYYELIYCLNLIQWVILYSNLLYYFIFQYKSANMDFIDFSIQQRTQQSQILLLQNPSVAPLLFSHKFVSEFIEQFEQTRFSCLLKKIESRNMAGKLIIRKKQLLAARSSLYNNDMIKCMSQNQKLILLKYFLKANEKLTNCSFRLNLLSGEINLQIYLAFALNNTISNAITEQFLIHFLDFLTQQTQKLFAQILYMINKEIQKPLQAYPTISNRIQFAHNLKRYCHSSSHYAWNMMQGNTRNTRSKQQIYQTKKSQFRKLRQTIGHKIEIRALNYCYNYDLCNRSPFFMLKMDQDQELKQKCLTRNNFICKTNKILNEIEINQKIVEKIKTQKQIQIKQSSGVPINLAVKFSKVDKQEIKYEINILKKLPQFQYNGLPKYYAISNSKTFNLQNLIFTNVVNMKSLRSFIDSNSQTISYATKFYIINQISNTLIYMRDHKIIYHNLTPINVKIRKNIQVKITDLTNTFHQEVPKKFQSGQNNTFPYIQQGLVYSRCSPKSDQRSESYSLGVLMNQLLFGKTPFHLKDSTSASLNELQKINNLCKWRPFSNEYLNSFGSLEMKVIFSFIQKSIEYKIVNTDWTQKQDIKVNLKGRPYLDWFSIITKVMQSYY